MTNTLLQQESKVNKKRMANMELLRILAMMMVVMLHYLGKGGLLAPLTESMGAAGYTAWGLESLSIVAVNVYMLISGYFLVEARFKVSRLLGLVLQALFYSLLVPVVLVLAGVLSPGEITLYQLLFYVFPTQMEHYWFLTAYVVMYLFSPLLGIAVHHMNKKQHGLVLAGLLLLISVGKSVLPVQLEMDNDGYDAVWFMCVYLVAAYIRLYGIPFFKNGKRSLALYFLGCAGMLSVTMLVRMCYLKFDLFEHFLQAAYDYNHLFNLFAAVALLCAFMHLRIPEGWFSKLVCKVAPYTFGVYLLHEQTEVRYLWPKWLGVQKLGGHAENAAVSAGRTMTTGESALCVLGLIGGALLAVLVVFIIGILVDMVRDLLFKAVGKILAKTGLLKVIKSLDAVFAVQGVKEEKQVDGVAQK